MALRSVWMTAALLAALAAPAAAQECALPGGLTGAPADSVRPPDVRIVASVSARELRFDSEPRAELRLNGCPVPDSAFVTERVNLPERVEPGVTYRDVRVGVEIRAWLNVQCLPALAAAEPALCQPVQVQTRVSPAPPAPA
jgi:hypothetical protein